MWLYLCGGSVAAVALLALGLWLKAKRDVREEARIRGQAVGTWTVYYDVAGARIGLAASFGADQLLRYLVFRAHDLFDYNQGMDAERRRLGEALRAAAHGEGTESWQLLFRSDAQGFDSNESPQLTRFFEGTLFDGGITRPRFLGGDAAAKQRGLMGEVVAIAAHLSRDPKMAPATVRAIDHLVGRELAEGTAPTGPRFWALPNDALNLA